MRITLALLLSAAAAHAETATAEWASFRGPNHDGTVPGLSTLSSSKLGTAKWKTPTNLGFSSFAVASGKAFTIVLREVDGNNTEVLVALDVKDGSEVWAKPLTIITKYDGGGNAGTKDNGGGDGPRSTPVVNDGKVYAIDANLGVYCFDAANGESVWTHDVMKENDGVNIKWQNAASPLIDGDLLFMAGGGKGEALLGIDKKSGKVKWKGEDDKMTHATPIAAEIHGVRQVIFFTQEGLVAVEPTSGKVLWRGEHPFNVSTAASPVVWQDMVYCSSGYGVGASCFKVEKTGSRFQAELAWRRENECFNHWSTPVVKDGYLYGMFSFKEYGNGPVACVDIRTGKDVWKQEGFGPGQVILAGNTVVAISDKGEVVFISANPEGYQELSRADVLDGKVWSYPVIAHGHLFARSTTEGGAWPLQ
jgi:outer membrane protein assembly factor BamB